MQAFSEKDLEIYKRPLNEHSVYQKVESLDDLCLFMEHHVYCVWDFMSLLKFLQSELAPSVVPWMPSESPGIQRLINEIVLEEETDGLPDGSFSSHFDMYRAAMNEIGADASRLVRFLDEIDQCSLEKALSLIPEACQKFTSATFSFIRPGQVHIAAVAFCIGRESIIPSMFKKLISQTGVSRHQAPMFYYYLERHIEIDSGKHGPMAVDLLNKLCGEDSVKITEAREAADKAVTARVEFLSSLEAKLNNKVSTC